LASSLRESREAWLALLRTGLAGSFGSKRDVKGAARGDEGRTGSPTPVLPLFIFLGLNSTTFPFPEGVSTGEEASDLTHLSAGSCLAAVAEKANFGVVSSTMHWSSSHLG